ncbi:MAG: hypothetical protein M3124_08145 [Actinomycetota bacterium]|nr:hypothetical protein [Actinomycetota bacterium]
MLTMLPVWDVVGNAPDMVAGVLPLTVLWSYAAFTLNFILAIVVYFTQFRPWAEHAERLSDEADPATRDDYRAATSRVGEGDK